MKKKKAVTPDYEKYGFRVDGKDIVSEGFTPVRNFWIEGNGTQCVFVVDDIFANTKFGFGIREFRLSRVTAKSRDACPVDVTMSGIHPNADPESRKFRLKDTWRFVEEKDIESVVSKEWPLKSLPSLGLLETIRKCLSYAHMGKSWLNTIRGNDQSAVRAALNIHQEQLLRQGQLTRSDVDRFPSLFHPGKPYVEAAPVVPAETPVAAVVAAVAAPAAQPAVEVKPEVHPQHHQQQSRQHGGQHSQHQQNQQQRQHPQQRQQQAHDGRQQRSRGEQGSSQQRPPHDAGNQQKSRAEQQPRQHAAHNVQPPPRQRNQPQSSPEQRKENSELVDKILKKASLPKFVITDSNVWMTEAYDPLFRTMFCVLKLMNQQITMIGIQFDEICNIKSRNSFETRRGGAARCALARIEVFQKAGLLSMQNIGIDSQADAYADPHIVTGMQLALKDGSEAVLISDDRELRIRARRILGDAFVDIREGVEMNRMCIDFCLEHKIPVKR